MTKSCVASSGTLTWRKRGCGITSKCVVRFKSAVAILGSGSFAALIRVHFRLPKARCGLRCQSIGRPMTPEEKARQEIDAMLKASGWGVQTKDKLNLSASRGVAVCALSFKTGEPDYTLF